MAPWSTATLSLAPGVMLGSVPFWMLSLATPPVPVALSLKQARGGVVVGRLGEHLGHEVRAGNDRVGPGRAVSRQGERLVDVVVAGGWSPIRKSTLLAVPTQTLRSSMLPRSRVLV